MGLSGSRLPGGADGIEVFIRGEDEVKYPTWDG